MQVLSGRITRRLPPSNRGSPPFLAPGQVKLLQHRRMDTSQRVLSDSALLARHVSSLDHQLGRHADTVGSLLTVQALLLVRQDCARQAIEARIGALGSPECPYYLIDPLGSLSDWPEPYAETPAVLG